MKSRPSRFALGGLVAAGIALALLNRERFAPLEIEAWVAQLGAWGPLLQKGLLAVGLLAALAILPSLVRRWRTPAVISPGELCERLSQRDPPLVLDVRNADEYAGELGHIEGSLLIPVADLEARLGELASHRGRLLVPV
jgi:hypothetical protein